MINKSLLVAVTLCLVARAIAEPPKECFVGYPRQYVARHLTPAESATMELDGRMLESVWSTVPWSAAFTDIQGDAIAPAPYLNTQTKMLWDDHCLYIAAMMEEPQAWAVSSINNSLLYQENDFEVLVDPDGCDWRYSELEINALGTQWNLLLARPYVDGGPCVCRNITPGQCASSAPDQGVYDTWDVERYLKYGINIDGALNNPQQGSKSWAVELCIPVEQYLKYSTRRKITEGDYWRLNMLRVQWHLKVEKLPSGALVYVKDPDKKCNNWAWQPTGVVNIHIPNRWGIVQFGSTINSQQAAVMDDLWPIRNALIKVYEAEHIYTALYGKGYTDSLPALVENAHLDADLASGKSLCVGGQPVIHLSSSDAFVVDIKSLDNPNVIGHITHERFISFTTTTQ